MWCVVHGARGGTGRALMVGTNSIALQIARVRLSHLLVYRRIKRRQSADPPSSHHLHPFLSKDQVEGLKKWRLMIAAKAAS